MDLSKPIITVGIPTKNSAWYLHKVLEAVCRLDYSKKKLRIVFVDDFSTDGTDKIIQDFQDRHVQEYERIIFLQQRSNIPQSRNLCIKNMRGDIMFFIDSDVVVVPRIIKRALKIFNSNQEIAIVSFPYHPKELSHFERTIIYSLYFKDFTGKPHPVRAVGMGCTLIRTCAIRAVGLFNERFGRKIGEDALYTSKISRKYIIIRDPTLICLHLKSRRGPHWKIPSLLSLRR